MDRHNKLTNSMTSQEIMLFVSPRMLDRDYCRRRILEAFHGNDPACPKCDTTLTDSQLQSFWNLSRVKCRNCGMFFTALTGTIFSGSQLDLETIFFIAVFLELGISNRDLASYTDLSIETIRLWRHRFEAAANLRE
ncbi:MAG: hypothetical protein JXB42_12780 [Deltaproteobacteria bacterium]|nr:hypothetical protein [Deltaproteobacteria bacterium]